MPASYDPVGDAGSRLAVGLLSQALPTLINHPESQFLIGGRANRSEVVLPTARTSPEVTPVISGKHPATVVQEMQQFSPFHFRVDSGMGGLGFRVVTSATLAVVESTHR